jgi:tetracycline resistance efflux pump
VDASTGAILLPTITVLVIAVATRSTLPALAGGVLLGHVLLDGTAAIPALAESLTSRLTTPTVAWVVLVCGLLGAITQLLVRAGGTTAFARLVSSRVHTGRGSLLAAWLAGLIIFIDDYLNVLLVGGGLRPVTDRLRVPRERLAYVVDATAAPVCLLVPLSTWAIYVAGLLETSGAAPAGQGMASYVELVPWIFYGWFAVAIVPLFVCGWIPSWGAMRAADERVAAGGDLAPPDSPCEPASDAGPLPDESLADFLIPVIALVGGTVVSGGDALRGGIWGLLAVVIQQGVVRRRMSAHDLAETACRGIGAMVPALATIVLAFMLQAVNARLGLTEFVIDAVAPRLPPALIPAAAFAVVSAVTFASGSFWGTYAIALPILIPLSLDAGMEPALTVAAVVSAGGFGSHACFFGDSTVLASQAAGCNNLAHARSQFPYALLGAGLTILAYLAIGLTVGSSTINEGIGVLCPRWDDLI